MLWISQDNLQTKAWLMEYSMTCFVKQFVQNTNTLQFYIVLFIVFQPLTILGYD